ncbi:hypothetical protein POX_a01506 [Penicillium oxalicum]|nr:hypothetical protein POX_a01506 [Penicillium oxalicum]KAI2794905.1 hypothetical protein POX_a01506 [Penicillium oxalicum]
MHALESQKHPVWAWKSDVYIPTALMHCAPQARLGCPHFIEAL